ncbi:hypothetical protein AAL_02577 [Moelleriella libera RCEF 2490]|uniref:Uncharacterized protein n=1 Tax=Moelleriella libera RCEF 2490 TaxID=1081109 RepID=A0A168EPR7_9HYPO|nr:hypothetical protein AAL_02577 [Moelleriella libera RCEF 2490]
MEDSVLHAIMVMCSDQIDTRLRLRVADNHKMKASPNKHLTSAINYFRQHPAAPFVQYARALYQRIETYENHRTVLEMKQVVEAAYTLTRNVDVSQCVGSIPEIFLEKTAKTALVNTIRKLARYKESARFLRGVALKYGSVKHMRLVPVKLPATAFDRNIAADPTLETTLRRIGLSAERNKARQIFQVLGHKEAARTRFSNQVRDTDQEGKIDHEEEAVRTRFSDQVRDTVQRGKIHAEVQLAYYCEAQKFDQPPRVICSSKSACFLCNTFINAIEKFHTPRCHGKLYPGWKLPHLPAHTDLATRFNAALGFVANQSVNLMLQRRQRTTYPDPNESTVSTLLTAPSLAPGTDLSAAHATVPEPLDMKLLEGTIGLESPGVGDNVVEDVVDSPAILTRMSEQAASSVYGETTIVKLEPGKSQTAKMGANHLSPFYEAWPLQIQMERCQVAQPKAGETADLPDSQYSIKWLSKEEAAVTRQKDVAFMFGVDRLTDEMTFKLGDVETFFLLLEGRVVRIHAPKRR